MESVLKVKSYKFALRVIKLYRYLYEDKREYVLSKQVLRSGTAIGALVAESEYAQSKADFANKLNIALKEANETIYWLSLLKDSGYMSEKMHKSIEPEIEELLKLLISSVKTAKKKKNEE